MFDFVLSASLFLTQITSGSTPVDVECTCENGAMICKSTDSKHSTICHQGDHPDCKTSGGTTHTFNFSKETLVAAATTIVKPKLGTPTHSTPKQPAPETKATKATCDFEGGGGGDDPYVCRNSGGTQICRDDTQV